MKCLTQRLHRHSHTRADARPSRGSFPATLPPYPGTTMATHLHSPENPSWQAPCASASGIVHSARSSSATATCWAPRGAAPMLLRRMRGRLGRVVCRMRRCGVKMAGVPPPTHGGFGVGCPRGV